MKTPMGLQIARQLDSPRVTEAVNTVAEALTEYCSVEETMAFSCKFQGLVLNGAMNYLGQPPAIADDLHSLSVASSARIDSKLKEIP